jgi:IS5 family transposase
MSHQLTFADSEFSTKRRQTRKEIFLSPHGADSAMAELTAVIEPFYPRRAMADGPIRWRPCCVFTACSIGTT